ncbi:MAG: lipase maturation factor family protein [Bryobacteraceae bacterium]
MAENSLPIREVPLLIYDGRCGFCRIWIEYWKALTGERVAYAASQEVGGLYPQIPEKNFSESVQLVLPGGEILSGARAVFTTLTVAKQMFWLLWVYEHVPGFAGMSEAAYRLIASHRTFFYHFTRLTFGKRVQPWKFAKTEWVFLRLLAAVYLIAFASLTIQITGLIGARGILPLGGYLAAVSKALGVRGYWSMPTIFWLAHGDWFLKAVCFAGVAISIALLPGILGGVWERLLLACLYVLYLSLCTAGQDFLSFQWDSLLLETGFLAIFLGNSKLVVLLFRWLLFRLLFLSGAVKLTSHDPVWRDWTALAYHYMTQPLPNVIAWYMYQLPVGFQRFSTAATLFVELFIPFLFFAPRMWRLWGAGAALFLQTLIFLTGNYTFFNLLTISLCVFLFDDRDFGKLRLREHAARTARYAVIAAAAVILALSISELHEMFFETTPEAASTLVQMAAPFQIANTYGLFASMTTTRPEIIVQGSNDGATWLDYQFRFKAGDLREPPHWVAPYQPRLDWQMWFAALADYRAAPWFTNFMVRLLQGSPDVVGLLGKNPFPNAPPKYVRAELFDYSFTNFATRRATGDWWARQPRGLYFPEISLEDLRPRQAAIY